MSKPTDREDGRNFIVRMPICELFGCESALSATQVTDGDVYCSDDCYYQSFYEADSSLSSLFDDPEALDDEDREDEEELEDD